MPKKFTAEMFIEAANRVHGDRYDYSNVVYRNQTTHVTIICKEHGAFNQKPMDHIHSGAGCPTCSGNEKVTLQKFLDDSRLRHGDRYDYSLVEIQNNITPVKIICKEHGVFEQSPKLHRKGHGCPTCGGTKRMTTEEFIARAKAKHGDRYDYSLAEYTTASNSVEIICKRHGVFTPRAEVHLRGFNCPKCGKEALGKSLFIGIEEARKRLSVLNHGYTYDLSEMTNIKSYITITCDKGHVFKQTYGDAFRYKCATCARRHSKGEQELLEFVQSLVPAKRSRKIIPPKELDVWCPEQKLGFEYNGLYYHSTATDESKWRHKEKSDAVRAAGGRLVHIWSDEWTYRRNATENMIRAQLGLLPTVGARKTTVRPVDTKTAKAFLEAWHLQGWANGEYLGLWEGDVLVACMGFSVARSVRGNQDQGLWELVRFCASKRVVGGASRLLAAWERTAHNWHTLITYCDLSVFDGKLYRAMGFELVGVSPPDYKVILAGGTERKHKSNVRKANLKKLLGDKYDESKSEAQMCQENAIFRVWDCGRAKYQKTRSA